MNNLAMVSTGALMATKSAPAPSVEQTRDYKRFKFMKGNRVVNPYNLKRITASMTERCLFSPILVNEKMEIIDGQHRFLALKELNLPIYYIVVPGYGVNEVHILNTNASNWKIDDYLKGYVDLGSRPYIQFKEFMEMFPELGIKSSVYIATQSKYDNTSVPHSHKKFFESGNLVIPDLEYAKEIARKIYDFKQFYEGFNRISFVIAAVNIIKHKNYNHEEMLSKLSRRHGQIDDQINSVKYRLQLEDIFNFHRRTKVNLRF